MADWFKFYETDLDDERLQWAMGEQPHVAIVLVTIKSRCCRDKSGTLPWTGRDFELFALANKVHISPPIAQQCLSLLETIEAIRIHNGMIEVLDWKEIQSEYCQKKSKGCPDSVPTVSRHSPDIVGLEERRGDKSRVEDRRESNASLLTVLFSEWNKLPGVPQCLLISDKRRRSLEARLQEPFFVANWKEAMQRVSSSAFCRGESDRGWRATFDWFITPDAIVKIMEGKYDGTSNGKPKTTTPDDEDWKNSL